MSVKSDINGVMETQFCSMAKKSVPSDASFGGGGGQANKHFHQKDPYQA
ncbi:MAG: hypothetical protein Ct9H300mP4_13470 [Gammaproteobacteria bacterium]|nr:MAG: hypothetical protein Ct9H300mP4_13470 [Gammaproteobacteria bacterium]